MKLRIRLILCLLSYALGSGIVQAQATTPLSITAVTPNPVCAGSSITISLTSNEPGNISVYLYRANQADSVRLLVDRATSAGTNILLPVPIPKNQPGGTYTVRLKRTAANKPTAYSRKSSNFTINAIPVSPTVASVTYCAGASAKPLSATGLNGSTFKWYTTQTGGTASSAAPTPSTSGAGGTTYYVSQTVNGCESDRVAVQVTVKPEPAAPSTKPVNVCRNAPAVSLASSVTATGTLRWYTAPTGGTAATVTPTPSTSAVGPTTYYVSQTVNGCESDRKALVYTVNALPTPPTVGSRTATYCQGTTPSALTATATGTVKWYTVRTGGTPLTNLVPSTAVMGSTNYYVSQTVNGCESARDSLTVTVRSKAAQPVVAVPAPYCQGATATALSATALTGNILKWYGTSETGGGASSTATIPATGTAGTTRYYVSQTDGNGCESDRVAISVTVNARPATPVATSLSVCRGATPPSLTTVVTATGTLKWYTVSTGGTAATVTPTPSTSAVGQTTYYVSQMSTSGCESERAAVQVTVKSVPTAPAVAANQLILCQSAVAAPLSATGTGTLKWYDPAGNPSTSLTPSTSAVATSVYKVSQVVNGCEGPPASLTVVVIRKPDKPAVAELPAYCQTATPVALSATGQNLKWYTTLTGGTSVTVAPTPATSTTGTTTYYVSQTDGNGCESDRATIAVQVKPRPTPPVTTSFSVCANQVVSLTATASAGGRLNWYGTNASGGTPTTTAPIPATTVIGTPVTYYVSQMVDGCESSRASFAVTVQALPAAPSVSATPVVYCQSAPATPLSATAVPGGSLNWYTTQTGGVASTSAPTPHTLSSNPLTSYYYVSQRVNGCEGPRASVAVTINPGPARPTVVSSLTYCQNAPAVSLSATAAGTLTWYQEATGGTAIPTPTPSTTTPGPVSYYVSQTDANGCRSERAAVTITIIATPTAPSTSPVNLCLNAAPTALSAVASNGGNLNWYTVQTGGTASATPPTPPVTSAGTSTYYVSESVNGCEGPRASLVVTVQAASAAPVVTAAPAYCQGVAATELVATPSGGGSLNWYTTPTGGTPTTAAPIPATTEAGVTTYYVSQTDPNGCESSRASITVRVSPLPAAPTTTPVSYCQGATATQLVATLTSGGNLNWYTTPTGGTSASVAPVPVTTEIGEVTYYVSQTDPTGCESERSPVVVTTTATPDAPVVTEVEPICQDATPVVLSATGENLNWYADATSTASLGSSITQPTTQAGTFVYYVSQTINSCESPRTQAQVVVNALPTAPAVTNQEGCQDAPVQSLTATGMALQWYDADDNLIDPPAPDTQVETTQTYTYQVTQTVGGCTSPKATLTYTVNVTPAPTVVSPVAFCQDTTAIPLEATGTSLKWISPAGEVSMETPVPSTSGVTGETSYSVTQTSTLGCESRPAEIRVVINALPTALLEGADTVNLGSAAQLTLTLTGTGPYSYTLSDGTTGMVQTTATAEATVQSITVTPATTTTYTVTAVTNACGSGTATGEATVTVLIPSITTQALARPTVCSGGSITVPFTTTGQFRAGNTFRVEIGSAASDSVSRQYIPVSSAVSQGTSIVTTIPPTIAPGQYYVRVSASNTSYAIVGMTSPTLLTVRPLPTVAFGVSRNSIYKGESAELRLALTGDGPWAVAYRANSETKAVAPTTNPFSVTVTPDTTTTYKLVSVSNGCGAGTVVGTDTATIRVELVLGETDPFSRKVTVYPVPTDDAVTVDIDLPLQNEPAQLRLTRADGQTTEQRTTRQRQTILHLANEPAGSYLLHIKIGDRSTVRRILKR